VWIKVCGLACRAGATGEPGQYRKEGIVGPEEAMSHSTIDLDDALVAEAAEILGTTTKRATVNGALAEFVAAVKRQRFMDMLEDGVFSDLGDPEVMAKAWR
jgi:Arc/MetJ family transcription regulator